MCSGISITKLHNAIEALQLFTVNIVTTYLEALNSIKIDSAVTFSNTNCRLCIHVYVVYVVKTICITNVFSHTYTVYTVYVPWISENTRNKCPGTIHMMLTCCLSLSQCRCRYRSFICRPFKQ